VKRRSSSGPTIGAMLGFWSGAVAMGAQGYGHASGRRPRAYDYRSVGE
jgi:hypothetical protein